MFAICEEDVVLISNFGVAKGVVEVCMVHEKDSKFNLPILKAPNKSNNKGQCKQTIVEVGVLGAKVD